MAHLKNRTGDDCVQVRKGGWVQSENTQNQGNNHCMAGLQLNNTGFNQNRKYVVIVAVKLKLVKLETWDQSYKDFTA